MKNKLNQIKALFLFGLILSFQIPITAFLTEPALAAGNIIQDYSFSAGQNTILLNGGPGTSSTGGATSSTAITNAITTFYLGPLPSSGTTTAKPTTCLTKNTTYASYHSGSGYQINIKCDSFNSNSYSYPGTLISNSSLSPLTQITIYEPYPGSVSLNWVDHNNLTTSFNSPNSSIANVNNVSFSLTPTSPKLIYTGSNSSCSQDYVFLDGSINTDYPVLSSGINTAKNWYLEMYSPGGLTSSSTNSSCVGLTIPISNLNNIANFNNYFTYQNSQTISSTDTNSSSSSSASFIFNTQGTDTSTFYVSYPSSSCISTITNISKISSSLAQGDLTISAPYSNTVSSAQNPFGYGWPYNLQKTSVNQNTSSNGCAYFNPVKINITNPINPTSGLPASQTSPTVAPFTGGGGGSIQNPQSSNTALSCHIGFNPLTWLLCPMIKGLMTVVSSLDNLINSELNIGICQNSTSTSPDAIFGSCSNATVNPQNDYYTAWSAFRDIAFGVLVIIALIVIISQAIKG